MCYVMFIRFLNTPLQEWTMARYSLNLPTQLKHQAERWAKQQGVSLNQFILWAVSEKVGNLESQLDDPRFPHVVYKRSITGHPTAKIRGTNLRVQTMVIAHRDWGLSFAQLAEDYEVTEAQSQDALAFYQAHRHAIDADIAAEETLEDAHA
jgi:uncharacterized protein (DUF433 family)